LSFHLRDLEFSRLPLELALLLITVFVATANLPGFAGDGDPMALLGDGSGTDKFAVCELRRASSVVKFSRVYSWS